MREVALWIVVGHSDEHLNFASAGFVDSDSSEGAVANLNVAITVAAENFHGNNRFVVSSTELVEESHPLIAGDFDSFVETLKTTAWDAVCHTT